MMVFYNIDSTGDNAVWEYNLTTTTWTQKTGYAINTTSSNTSTTLIQNKTKVFVVSYANSPSYYEYDLSLDSWEEKLPVPLKVSGATAIYYNNGTDDIMTIFDDVWEYNITKAIWTKKTNGATAREDHTAIHYNNGTDDIMTIFGGSGISGYLNDVWDYNLTKDTWTQKTSGATAREDHTAIHYNNGTDDIMVIFGGYDNNYTTLNDVWEYNITTDTWTQKTSGATARYGHTAIYYNNGTDDLMVIFGGIGTYLGPKNKRCSSTIFTKSYLL